MDRLGTRFLLVGLVILIIVSVGLSFYLKKGRPGDLFYGLSSRVALATEFTDLKVEWNERELEKQLKELRIFSKEEIVLPVAQYAPPTVPKELLRHKVERLEVVIAKDTYGPKVGVVPKPGEVNVWPSAGLLDGGNTLRITLSVHPQTIDDAMVSDDKLSEAISATLLAYLEEIVNASSYNDRLGYYLEQNQTNSKFVTLNVRRR